MRGKWVAIVAATAAIATQVHAGELDECVAIENDLDRLACYDDLSGRTPEVSVEEIAESAWTVRTEVSEFTDEANVFLWVVSEDPVVCRWGDGARVQLSVRCLENTTAIIFNTQDCHLASSAYSDYGHVDVRVDDQPARTWRMDESTDNSALGFWSGGRAIPEIKRLFGGQQLIARMTPYGENPFTLSFDITGLEEAIVPLREACHW